VKKYQITINEIEAAEAENPGSNINQQLEENRRRLETYIRILKVAEAIIFLAIAVLTLLLDWPDTAAFKLPSLKIIRSEKP